MKKTGKHKHKRKRNKMMKQNLDIEMKILTNQYRQFKFKQTNHEVNSCGNNANRKQKKIKQKEMWQNV